MDSPHISAVVTFHNEGRLAHVSLNSIARTRDFAVRAGISVELLLVLDRASATTRQYVFDHPLREAGDQVIEVAHGDLSASRNEAIALARGTCIAIFDGDDLYSANWLQQACEQHRAEGGRHIYHPEITVSFDALQSYNFTVDQRDPEYNQHNLLMTNYWCSCTYAAKQVFLDHPYQPKDGPAGGFGFEDWHWNCETVAAGMEHRVVAETALFYRRKRSGSLNAMDSQASRIIRPSRLFSLIPAEAGDE